MLAEFEWVSMKVMKVLLLLNLVSLLMTELKSSCYNVEFFDIFNNCFLMLALLLSAP